MFVHSIDPLLGTIGGIHLWWYGLSYTLGFWSIHSYLRHRCQQLAVSLREVYSLTLCLSLGVLIGGRLVEVAFDEWPFYRENPHLIPALWLGGMATHGLLLGAAAGLMIFAHVWRKPFLVLADALVIPGAFLMGIGRIGNFIDGQIVGSVTTVAWGVQFPDAEGIRHPVVLYDGAKNLLLIPYLLWERNRNATPGALAARFVFWYAFPRIFIDAFRDYPTHRLAIGTGQTLNILMTLLGIVLLVRSHRRRCRTPANPSASLDESVVERSPAMRQRFAFAVLLVFCLTIPSNWTQDIAARYSKRHQGLEHSWMYPVIDTAPRIASHCHFVDLRSECNRNQLHGCSDSTISPCPPAICKIHWTWRSNAFVLDRLERRQRIERRRRPALDLEDVQREHELPAFQPCRFRSRIFGVGVVHDW